MADDKAEGQEVDLLIRELSSSPAKRTTAQTTESQSGTPAVSVPAPGQRSTTRAVAPPVGSRGFVSAISVQSPKSQSWFEENVRERLTPDNLMPTRWIPTQWTSTHRFQPAGTTAVWMWVGLGVALALAMPFWPYPKACAWWLLLYLFAVAMVVVTGIWTARLTWVTRLGVAHMVALGIVFWGITLAAEETLPRIGYAKTEAAWFCR